MFGLLIAVSFINTSLTAQTLKENPALDEKVKSFFLTIQGNGTI